MCKRSKIVKRVISCFKVNAHPRQAWIFFDIPQMFKICYQFKKKLPFIFLYYWLAWRRNI